MKTTKIHIYLLTFFRIISMQLVFTRKITIYLFISIFITSCTSKTGHKNNAEVAGKPNIILIMVDDLGFSDLGCYGGEIETPNIDGMAKNGIRFSQFYNGARCCPSRASLLTGLYAQQAGVGHMIEDKGYPGYSGDLSTNAVTIAEVLKEAGYMTSMAGKWHVTKYTKEGQSEDNHPTKRGFDRFYGTIPGHGSLWDPYGLKDGDNFIKAEGKDYYYTEAITAHAIENIQEANDKNIPFFLYVAYTAPHYPLHARQEIIDKYKGRFADGWDKLRYNRYQKLIEEGLIDSHSQLSPRDEQSIPWEEEPQKEWQQNRMETYAAMVDHVDQGVGDILNKLRQLGQLDNTLVMFFSDNGGSAEGHRDGLIERWGTPWADSLIPEYTREGKKVRAGDFPDLKLGPDYTYGSYGVRWANVSNTPFRQHKSWVHEGGISSPLILFWPNGFQERNTIRHDILHIIDIMPTCLEISGAQYPESFKGNEIIPFQGESILTSIQNRKDDGDRTLFWEHEGNRAIRKGKWKLVSEYPGTWSTVRAYKKKGEWELYNMEIDRTEMNDLSGQQPDLVKELSKEWQQWANRSRVIPWDSIQKSNY